jgi:hypothetical protein
VIGDSNYLLLLVQAEILSEHTIVWTTKTTLVRSFTDRPIDPVGKEDGHARSPKVGESTGDLDYV